VFNLLDDGRTVILVNAQHMKAIPGSKTDIKDSEWLADLLRHGLLKASFIPPVPSRLGKQKAVIAVSHSLLVIIYHVLSTKQPYSDLGADYFEQRDSARLTQRSVRQLEALGYKVTFFPKEVAEAESG